MALVPHFRPASWRARLAAGLGRKAAELVTVFVGVYAAFLLNDYQSHREERQRREQILGWLEKTYSEEVTDIQRNSAHIKEFGDEFHRTVATGAMPPLHAFHWQTDYQASDLEGLLQSGGYTLLEVETIRSLKEADATLREMVEVARHDQQLSDALILPNLDKDPSMFYDPTTKQLRPPYAWYGEFSDTELSMFAQLEPQVNDVLKKVRAEQARAR